jgi:DNA-binding response OmpR family regulator
MRKRILIVDDSPTSRMWQQLILSREPYEVRTASDGAEGCARAAEWPADLVLLDVMMPTMDGFSACRQLRAHAATAHVPVIMVTTRGEEWNVEQGYACGCTDYVTKPIDRLEFLAKIRSWLGEGTAERTEAESR